MMKKKFTVLLSLGIACGACLIGGACSGKQLDGKGGEDYAWKYEQEFAGEPDDGVKIDGVADEAMWQNKNYIEHSENRDGKPINFRMTTAFSDRGVYVYGEAEDETIEYNGRFAMTKNSGFTVFLAAEKPNGVDEVNQRWRDEVLRLDFDAKNSRSWEQAQVLGKTVVEGELNSQKTSKMKVEMFVTWKALLEESSSYWQGKLDENGYFKAGELDKENLRVKLYPMYRQKIPTGGGAQASYSIQPTFTESDWPALYPVFDKNGFTQSENPNSVLGSAGNGLSKTSGWQLQNVTKEDNSIAVSGKSNQAIYFKNVNATNLVVEATVTPGDTVRDLAGNKQNGQFGLIVQKSFSEFRAIHLKTNQDNEGFTSTDNEKKNIVVSAMTFYPNRSQTVSWGVSKKTKNEVNVAADATSVRLKMIKLNGWIAFFVNDTFMFQEHQSYIEGDCVPGLYVSYNEAVFTDYSATVLDTEEKINAELREHGLRRVGVSNVQGGKVKVTKANDADLVERYFYRTEDDVQLTFRHDMGYALSSVKVNGAEKFDEIKTADYNGTYILSAATLADNNVVDVSYSDLVVGGAYKKVYGSVNFNFDLLGKLGAEGLTMHVEAIGMPWYCHDVVLGANGTFNLQLLQGGTALPNGAGTVQTGENYKLSVKFSDVTYTKTLAIGADYNESTEIDFELAKKGLQPLTSASTAIGVEPIANSQMNAVTFLRDGTASEWMATSATNAGTFQFNGYNAVKFSLDTTGVPADKPIKLDFQMKIASNSAETRPTKVYAVSENGTMQVCAFNGSTIQLPVGFKGEIVIRLEDFTRFIDPAPTTTMTARLWMIVDATNKNGVSFQMGNVYLVDYLNEMFRICDQILNQPASTGNNLTVAQDTVTFSRNNVGVYEDWLKIGTETVAINHSAYDSLVMSIDTTGLTADAAYFAFELRDGAYSKDDAIMSNGERENRSRRASVIYLVSDSGEVTRKTIQSEATPSRACHVFEVPKGFKGKLVIMLEDVNRYQDKKINTSVKSFADLKTAVWMIALTTDELNGSTMKLSDVTFVRNGASLIKK